MNKRRLHHLWTRLRFIRPWYFLIIAIASAVICVFALRANNQQMITLRNAVYAADQNNTDVQAPLQALRAYVTAHMNTNLNTSNTSVYPPIQLKYTYDRLVKAQGNQVAQANAKLYSAAQAYCESQNSTDFSGHNRVPCIEQYVQGHNTQKVSIIPDALYKFSFITPTWSPDLAGSSLAAAITSGILFIFSFLADRWFRRYI